MAKMTTRKLTSHNLTETQAIGAEIFSSIVPPFCIYLEGDLGAGKTTLCQAIIAAAGYEGAVTSPTYNLIQEYPLGDITIYHMDLYRLDSPQELEYLGVVDLWNDQAVFLIEWPERGKGYLPERHLSVSIKASEEPQKRVISLMD